MFHRSYTPSSQLDQEKLQQQRNQHFRNTSNEEVRHYPHHNNARASSLDFELYSPHPSSSNHHQLFNNHQLPQSQCDYHHDDQEEEQLIQWFLFQSRGIISFRLSTQKPTLIGTGSECDIRILHQETHRHYPTSSSTTAAAAVPPVEKRHAVLAFEPSSNCFTVKDLNTTNGTYVNNRRLYGDHPETVSNLDVLRFGYDIHFIREATDTSLSSPGGNRATLFGGVGGEEGPSSLPPTLNSYNSKVPYSSEGVKQKFLEGKLSRSVSTEDNHQIGGGKGLPPKGSNSLFGGSGVGSGLGIKSGGGSPFLQRKSLLTKKNSDPGGGFGGVDSGKSLSGGIFSERLAQFQRRSSAHESSSSSPHSAAGFSSNLEKSYGAGDRTSLPGNVMQQGGRSGTSGVCSPSLTLDSGRGSSSVPSSPAKEMSPVQMVAAAAANTATSPTSVVGGSSSIGTMSSSQSHNASPVFARKLSRPMEYLLGQSGGSKESGDTSDTFGTGVDPHYSFGLSSGNYTSFCSGSEPISFATSGSSGPSANYNQMHQNTSSSPLGGRGNGGTPNLNNNINCGFPSDCEILHITEDFDNVDDQEDVVVRKDSLEEDEQDNHLISGDNQVMLKSDNSGRQGPAAPSPQFLVGGDIMQPDLNVPNEVFGPLSHAEILNRNNLGGTTTATYKNINCNNNLNNSELSLAAGKQGNNKPVLADGYTNHAPRARSSSGDGGSNRSTPLSALYGTPHWWPDSPPPEENSCPPPPASSTNASPFKKPFLLNNNRLKGNSSSSSIPDPVKDLSLESTHSQRSGSQITSNRPCSPAPASLLPLSSSPLEETSRSVEAMAEVKKLTPMAFTIDLSDNGEIGGVGSEAAEAKKAAIAERLSKFAPRHRRNASLTKSDDVVGTGTEPFSASSTLPKQTKSGSGSNSLGRTQQHQQRQSSVTTSGGAESSTSGRCASLPKKLSSSGGGGGIGIASISKHPSGGSNNDSGLRSLSPETISSTTSSSRSRPVIDSKSSAKKNFSSDNNNLSSSMGRKGGGGGSNNKSAGGGSRGGTPVSKRATTPRSDGLRSSYTHGGTKADNNTAIKLNDLSKGSKATTTPAVISPSPVAVDKEDTVSEAGTYTVEKEAPEVLSARENIEQIFGLNNGEDDEEEMDKENNLDAVARASSSEVVGDVVVVGGAEPGTRDWVREWAELAAQQHQQKKHQRPELPDSQYFLRETETLVSAIQERVSKHMKSGGGESASLGAAGSDSDDDEPTLSHHTPVKSQSQHSTPTNTGKRRPPSRTSPFHREASVLSDSGYAIGYQSDSSNEGSSSTHHLHQTIRGRGSDLSCLNGILTNKMNRAFNIRRGGGRNFGYESTVEPQLNNSRSQQSITGGGASTTIPLNNTRGISPRPAQQQVNSLSKCNNIGGGGNSSSTPNFARNDGGRFSLRMAKSRTPPAQMPPPSPRVNSYSGGGSGEAHGRMMMNGHKSESREQSVGSSAGGGSGKKYTPAGKSLNNSSGGGGGANKKSGNRSNSTLTAKEVELANWKRRKNYDPMKAAAEGKKNVKKNGATSSASGAESGVEESSAALPPIPSPKVNRREAMLTKSLSFHQESFSPKCASEEEDMIYIVDEMDSSHSNSPNHLGGGGGTGMTMTRSYHEDVMYYGMSGSAASMRPKNKLEALDNLVIATIHSLSNKVRTSSRHLLEKMQTQHTNDENGALLEEMVSQLKELEVPSNNSSPNKSPSRELSGTLKNLKKLEQVVLVLDKVLCDGFESDVNG